MATVEQYQKVTEAVISHFGFSKDSIHEHITALLVPGTKSEVCRLVYDAEQFVIGLAFHVEGLPTDVIQIWEYAMTQSPDVVLLNMYYQSESGEVYSGLDAQIMMDQEKQNKLVEVIRNPPKPVMTAEEEAQWNLKQMEKKGKITFH